ncbi:MAG: 50S ribosomal protein L25 [Clostridium sp.]
MYTLNAEKRDLSVKAKKLRTMGMVPGTVYGGSLKENLQIQIEDGEVRKLLKAKGKGGNVVLVCGDDKLNVLLKEMSYAPATRAIESMSFQSLLADELVTATAQIVLINKDKTVLLAQQILDEVPYRTLPAHLVEKIEIDMATVTAGSCIKIEDLDIAKNPNIEVLMPADSQVVNIIESYKTQPAVVEEVTEA